MAKLGDVAFKVSSPNNPLALGMDKKTNKVAVKRIILRRPWDINSNSLFAEPDCRAIKGAVGCGTYFEGEERGKSKNAILLRWDVLKLRFESLFSVTGRTTRVNDGAEAPR